MNSNDTMVDLETTGTSPGCCILSIGACTFSGSNTFYQKIDHLNSKVHGLRDSPATMAWWHKQNPSARIEAFSGTLPLIQVLGAFYDWYKSIPGTKYIWGNGADFDLPILKAAYQAVDMKEPWAPYNGRCYRTLKNLYKDIPMPPFEGEKHNALADAMMQARHAHLILQKHFKN